VRFRQYLAAMTFIVSGNLFAEFEADFGIVPGRYLNSAIFSSRDGQRLIGYGLGLFIANICPVFVIANPQVLAAIVARRIIIHRDS